MINNPWGDKRRMVAVPLFSEFGEQIGSADIDVSPDTQVDPFHSNPPEITEFEVIRIRLNREAIEKLGLDFTAEKLFGNPFLNGAAKIIAKIPNEDGQ